MRWGWRFIRFLTGNCDVCGGKQHVKLSKLTRGLWDDRGPARGLGIARAMSISVVVPCPHCADPSGLVDRLPPVMERSPGVDVA